MNTTTAASTRLDSAEILSQQAASLLAGLDRTPELLAATASADRAELEGLMGLARRLNSAMLPVAPRPGFAAELRTQLDLARPAAEAARQKEKEQRRRWMAGIGGAVYLLSLGFVTYRTAQAVTGRVGPWARTRKDAAVTPPALAAEPVNA
jgi:hypothetical protein